MTKINIRGVNTFTLFDSGAEMDALSPDFVRACNLPLLELPNPMVLQMGTKGSCSCVYYGTNVDIKVHGIKKSHYFNVVNIDRYNVILGAPWLNVNDTILNFREHIVSLPSGDLETFDILTEQAFWSVGSNTQYKSNSSHVTTNSPHNK